MREKKREGISKEKEDELFRQYPYLNSCPTSPDKATRIAYCRENARKELRHVFLRTKILVRRDRNQNDRAFVMWVDGPTTSQVSTILEKYVMHYDKTGRFINGIQLPYKVYHRDTWTLLYGGIGEFVFRRQESPALLSFVAGGMGHKLQPDWIDKRGNFTLICNLPGAVQQAILAKARRTAVLPPKIMPPKAWLNYRERFDAQEINFEEPPHPVICRWLHAHHWKWHPIPKYWSKTAHEDAFNEARAFERGQLPEPM